MTTQTPNTVRIDTTRGPSIEELFHALRYAYGVPTRGKPIPQSVSFTDNLGRTLHIQVTSLEHEDGSGVSFNLTGKVIAVQLGDEDMTTVEKSKVTAYYNAQTRRGVITL